MLTGVAHPTRANRLFYRVTLAFVHLFSPHLMLLHGITPDILQQLVAKYCRLAGQQVTRGDGAHLDQSDPNHILIDLHVDGNMQLLPSI